ncbi:MAG: calx-beta domain protein, partial [Microcystis sp. LE19-338.1B]|nr:calx-beta domain protein [Microcystis sp. LE19-338.1B]
MNYPIVVTAGGTIVSGENGYLTTSRTAETVVTFDIGFTSLPSYTGGSIRQGDQFGFWLAPSGDNTSNYLSVDPLSGTPSVISAPNGTLWKYFGLYWGSIDDYNSIEFWKDNTRIAYYSGSDIATLLNLRGGYINFDVNNNDGYFNKIILTSTQQAFESDNHAFISEFPSITLAVAPSSVNEDGTSNLIYTFTRTGDTTNPLTVNYSISGTATNGSDYTSIPTSVTFAANSATATVTVDPTADTTVESDETVALTLTSGTGYIIGTTNAATGTITNDDTSVTLAVSPSSVTEDGTTNLVYTFTRTGVTTNALTVNYTLGGTATLNTDYTRTGTTNTVTFAANSATATLTVDPTADTIVESNETVILTLASGTGYAVGTTTPVTGTIT